MSIAQGADYRLLTTGLQEERKTASSGQKAADHGQQTTIVWGQVYDSSLKPTDQGT